MREERESPFQGRAVRYLRTALAPYGGWAGAIPGGDRRATRSPGYVKTGAYARASRGGFMGKKWDTGEVAFDPAMWREVLRVLKPGAHLLAFGGTRTYHRLACAIEDAGFEMRDMIAWLYGSGFPKSHSVERVLGSEWEGWGTALKPALEPITLARKPLVGTVAANVAVHRTGALNIVASRIGDDASRWPANVIHDGSEEVRDAFPETAAGWRSGETFGWTGGQRASDRAPSGHTDAGSAARYFYSAKADAEDRLGSKHPTVKPVDLIAYLIRLITPPGGTVLDPFAGSGTLGMACMREGFDAILIEREAEYIADIRRRINHVQGNDTPLFGGSTVSPPPARVVPSTDGSRTKDRPDGIAVMIEKEEAA